MGNTVNAVAVKPLTHAAQALSISMEAQHIAQQTNFAIAATPAALSAQQFYDLGAQYYLNESWAEASENFIKAKQLGHVLASLALARMYLTGRGFEASTDTAIGVLESIPESSGLAEIQLGHIYLRGLGKTPINVEKAIFYFKKAEAVNPEAKAHLAFMKIEGHEGVEKNFEEGFKLLTELVPISGDANNYLGFMYMENIGVERDYSKAYTYFTEAKNNGVPAANVNLALLYLNGWGVSKNTWEAARLLTLVAERGYPIAQAYLGLMYRDGVGVLQNDDVALKWLKRSSDAGDTFGMYSYAKFLLERDPDSEWGTIVDLFMKAAEKGNSDQGELYENLYVDALEKIFDDASNNS